MEAWNQELWERIKGSNPGAEIATFPEYLLFPSEIYVRHMNTWIETELPAYFVSRSKNEAELESIGFERMLYERFLNIKNF